MPPIVSTLSFSFSKIINNNNNIIIIINMNKLSIVKIVNTLVETAEMRYFEYLGINRTIHVYIYIYI